jgi:hypothetical protein
MEQVVGYNEALAVFVHQDFAGMKYGGPAYNLEGGPILCGFTAQKNNLAFYVGEVPDEFRVQMKAADFSLGKGAVRFKRLDSEKVNIL